jgi:hypothetical protein
MNCDQFLTLVELLEESFSHLKGERQGYEDITEKSDEAYSMGYDAALFDLRKKLGKAGIERFKSTE